MPDLGDGEGAAYLLLLILVLMLIVGSAIIPHFWAFAVVVLCTLQIMVIWRQLRYEEKSPAHLKHSLI